MLTRYDFFYDGQQRRYLEQLVRFFSGFQYETGRRNGDDPQLRVVPCKLVTSNNRMVEMIRRNNSENTLLTVPMISVYRTGLTPRREDVQTLSHIDEQHVSERRFDPLTGAYTGEKGNSYTVERMMPRPFNLLVNVDIWTSNMEHKDMLVEQIMTIIYPAFEIQNSDNALDWSSLTTAFVEDFNLLSNSIPVGNNEEIEVASIQLRIPIYLNPPVRVTRQRLIHQIVNNIHHGTEPEDVLGGTPLTRSIITPGNHLIDIENGTITLLDHRGEEIAESGAPLSWAALFDRYGSFVPGESQVRLRPDIDDDSRDIVGTAYIDPDRPNKLSWQIDVDTLPANTLPPVAGVVDPLRTSPLAGLGAPVAGQRYLLINEIGEQTVGWELIEGGARTGDIIEYDGSSWRVVFDNLANAAPQYVHNLNTGRQLRWTSDGWALAIDGMYAPGTWRIAL